MRARGPLPMQGQSGRAMRTDIKDECRGQWRSILPRFGVPETALTGRHGPCPICGGKDRFRFDDIEGNGTWVCSQCDGFSGVDLVMNLHGWTFLRTCDELRKVIASADITAAPRSTATPPAASVRNDQDRADAQRRSRRTLWEASRPLTPGDDVCRYLNGRGITRLPVGPSLRICDRCIYGDGMTFPAMIAAVQDPDRQGVSLHRTFLKDAAKAPVAAPRKLMPGPIPDGSAVRLASHGAQLGIAEGIETALAASELFSIPTWAALTTSILKKWWPPEGVKEVVIFGDNDTNGAGQRASEHLAERLRAGGFVASIKVPAVVGTDWADVLALRKRGG